MARYADPSLCPACGVRLPTYVSRCPVCAIDLSSPLASELLQTLRTADDLLDRLRVESAQQPAGATRQAAYPAPATAPPTPGLPRSDDQAPRGLSGASVPRILLSLGALCLLVASVIFLAVAWAWLGVGGRTAVLVGLTGVSGGLGLTLGRRGLRVAAEALTTVSLGLLALDVVGADNAGWLGDLSDESLLTITSATVLAAALALSVITRLGAPQLVAAFAVAGVGLGAALVTEHPQLVAALVVVAYAALAVAARPSWLALLRVVAVIGGAWVWVGLAVSGLDDATGHATWRALWLDYHGFALLAASVLVLLPLLLDRSHAVLTHSLVAAAAALLTLTVAMAADDESATTVAVVALAVLGVWTAAGVALPTRWHIVPLVSMALGAAPVAAVVVTLAAQAAVNALDTASPFSGTIGLRLGDPDPVAAPVLLVIGTAALVGAVATLVGRSTALALSGGGLVLASLVGTMALYPVPVWAVTAGTAVIGAALLTDGVRRTQRLGQVEVAVAVAVLVSALVVALPSALLTALVAAVLVLGTAAVRWLGAFPDADLAGGLLLPVATGVLIWSALTASGVETQWRGLPVLVVVGLMAIVLSVPETEIAAGLAALAAASAAVAMADHPHTSLAIHLTVAGTLVTASALLHADRRALGWLGGALLVAATWVRLADLGVRSPEAYTLPSAAALLVLGLVRLHRDPSTPTARALTPGLLLATVPSLLWVLVDPVSLRAGLLGAGCLVLVLAGLQLRWGAPLVVGASVGGLLVLRELAPYAAAVPQWVLIGIAGTVLTVVGITWEHRMRDVRHASGYLRRLL